MKNSVLCYLEDIVKTHSEKIAIVDKDTQVTFKELRDNALCIATEIKKYNIQNRSPILVYLPKSIISIVSFMGVLYSGNFYTPTDIKFPFEKVNSVIKCLEPELIISDTKNKQNLVNNGIKENVIINVDEINFDKVIENNLATNLINQIIDTDIVYTLFTSGSTGVPKGVSISNRSIIDYIDWVVDCYKINNNIKIGNQAPFYFDNSTLDIYATIKSGATLYIIPELYFSFPAKLMEYIQEERINMVFWVPSVLINVANNKLLEKIDCDCLKKVLFAGEVMPNKQLNYWRKCLPDSLYSNLYGPTEITVDCTYYIVNRDFGDDEVLPIGFPCRNSNVFVLDEENRLINESDKVGELCVRGSSLAVGYWNDFARTEEVFVQNPLNKHYPERIYKTGDLVYYNKLGELIFVGRKDFQIKHMGYRIELGEIETAVMSINDIKNCCCLYNLEKKEITLFYELDKEITEVEIRKKLGTIIPKYMIPTKYIKLGKLPHNDNGKIDRKQLQKCCF